MITSRSVVIGLAVAAALAACSEDETGWPSPSPSPPSSREDAAPATPPEPPRPVASLVPRCVDGDSSVQRHGATCLCCHADGFGVAGSVDPKGPPVTTIVVTDARGDVATMSPNLFSNFFRHFTMTPPFRAVVHGPDGRSLEMKSDAPIADCNACHYTGGPVPLIHGP